MCSTNQSGDALQHRCTSHHTGQHPTGQHSTNLHHRDCLPNYDRVPGHGHSDKLWNDLCPNHHDCVHHPLYLHVNSHSIDHVNNRGRSSLFHGRSCSNNFSGTSRPKRTLSRHPPQVSQHLDFLHRMQGQLRLYLLLQTIKLHLLGHGLRCRPRR